MIDIGANLTDSAFKDDRDAVLQRALDVGVEQIVLTGTSVQGSKDAAVLAKSRPGFLFATAGVHPHDAKSFDDSSLTELGELCADPQVVAVGECGLDFNRDFSPRPKQREVFRAQLELAVKLSMPVFVHERDAASDLLTILDSFAALPPIVVHCFTGTGETLAEYLKRDFYIGITGWICDERRGLHLRELVGTIPEDRLMIETDAPYLLPRTIRPRPKSRRNEPANLTHVAQTIAEARGVSVAELTRSTTEVARAFFSLNQAEGS